MIVFYIFQVVILIICLWISIGYFLFYRNVKLPNSSSRKEKLNYSKNKKTIEDFQCFQPISFRGVTLKNRIVRAAAFGGADIDSLIQVHSEVAQGGVGLTTVAYASVSKRGCTFHHQIIPSENEWKPKLKRLTKEVHNSGGKISLQLTHGGNFADPSVSGKSILAPSKEIFSLAALRFPTEISKADMRQITSEFAEAASVAKQCGFDVIELHLGHGYLLSQFISPTTNCRKDEYGGSIENRIRFPLEVLHEVRGAVGADFPIFVKLNVNDGVEGGVSYKDVQYLVKALEKTGEADCLVLSGGFVSQNGFYMLRGKVPRLKMMQNMPSWIKKIGVAICGLCAVPTVAFSSTFFLEPAKEILKESNIPICLLGGVTTLNEVEGAMEEGFSLVQMARALIREPELVHQWEKVIAGEMKTSDIKRCNHCNQCVVSTLNPDLGVRCVLRDIEELQT